MTKPKTPEDYISAQEVEYQQPLSDLHHFIQSLVPDATAFISYDVICFKTSYMLVGIGVKKGHLSLYTMSPALVKKLESQLNGVRFNGSTLHFPIEKPLPLLIIKRIIVERVKENDIRELAKLS